jgi:anti-anti-sigma regulatory factor
LLYKGTRLVLKSGQMLKIQRATNKQVVFTLSGRMDAENVAELKGLIESEASGRHIVLELRDLTLVDRDAVRFLERCETDSVKLENCPAYIREWIAREREGK